MEDDLPHQGQLIDHNVFKPEAKTRPSTVVIPVSLSTKEHLRSRDDVGYNLAQVVLDELESKYDTQFDDEENQTVVGPNRSDLETVVSAMKTCEGYAFRWFRTDGTLGVSTTQIQKTHEAIVDNLNKTGVEFVINEKTIDQTYLSADDPSF